MSVPGMVVEVAKQVAYDKRMSEASVMRANTRNLEYTYRQGFRRTQSMKRNFTANYVVHIS